MLRPVHPDPVHPDPALIGLPLACDVFTSAGMLAACWLRAADFHCARIGGRHHRPPRSSGFVFQELFGREMPYLDSRIAARLPGSLGIYPPATLLRPAHREAACIARRAPGGAADRQPGWPTLNRMAVWGY